MTPSRAPQGRGRPALFDQAAQEEYLRLLAAGARIQDAADTVGISRRTPNQHATRDPAFARRLDEAKTTGAHALHGTPPHTTPTPDPEADTTAHKPARLIPLPAPVHEPGEPKIPVLAEVS